MADETPPRRLLSLLRRRPRAKTSEHTRDSNLLWLSHERASNSVKQATDAIQQISSNIARQRTALDAALDRARVVYARADQLLDEARGVSEALEKLLMVSMNTSLEGTRQPEGSGQPFLLIGEEVRAHARRGLDLMTELRTSAAELSSSVSETSHSVEQAKEASLTMLSESGRANALTSNADRALEDIREVLKRTTGTDPETMKLLGEAAEHAKALVTSIGTLSGKVPKSLMASVLRPTIEPLLNLLSADEEDSNT
jgi:ABC-type transporter Mla subunit MlaD